MDNVPYNTGKVQIGLEYESKWPYLEQDRDMLAWQKVMLCKPNKNPYRYLFLKIIFCILISGYLFYVLDLIAHI